jgi:signal transduction histidine kinase/DNA-binding NarL/FixJ family response regulator
MWRLSTSEFYADYFCRLLTCFSFFMPITAYHFSIVLAGGKPNRALRYGYIGALLLCLLMPSKLIMQGVAPKFGHLYWPEAGPLTGLYLTFFFGYLLASAKQFLSGWKQNLGILATGNLFFLCTWIVGSIGGLTNFPLWFDIPLQPYGNVFLGIFLIILSHALYHNLFPSVRIEFYKNLLFIVLCVTATLPYLLLLTHHFNQSNAPLSPDSIWVHGLGAFLVIAVIFWGVPNLKYQIERVLAAVFISEQGIGLIELKELPAEFPDLKLNQSIFNRTVDVLERVVPTHSLTILIRELEGGNYQTVARAGKFSNSTQLCELASNDPLIESLAKNPRALVIEKITQSTDSSVYQSLVNLRNQLKLSLLIPIFSNHQLYGLILLGPLKSKQSWEDETTAVLFNLGAQIGIHFRTRELETMVELRSIELEQRNQQLEKAHTEKLNFLTSFSHEIRNPLNGLLSISRLLAEDKDLTDTQSELIDYLISCKKHLEQLIIPALDYSSLEAGIYNCTEEQFDVNIAVKSVVAMHSDQAIKKGLQVKWDLPDIQYNWIGAVTPLRQILINLISNAINYTASGFVSLELSYQQFEDSITATFRIKDTGQGIPLNQQAEIFEPFARIAGPSISQPVGSGVGLSISRRIAETLQGALSLKESALGSGTVFELILPFKLGNVIDVSTSRTKAPQILNGKFVLIADDMDFNRYAYRILLERMGAIVVEVNNGAEALKKLQSEKFDVAILDVNMPVMDGKEVVQEYFLTPPVNPPLFIAFSAQADSVSAADCLSAGFRHFIEKPLTADKLRELFNSKQYKSSQPEANLLDYLGEANPSEFVQLEMRYRHSFNQGIAELMQHIKLTDESATHGSVHKLRGLACLQNNTNVMSTLDDISALSAANALPHEYTQLLKQLKSLVNDDAVPVSN